MTEEYLRKGARGSDAASRAPRRASDTRERRARANARARREEWGEVSDASDDDNVTWFLLCLTYLARERTEAQAGGSAWRGKDRHPRDRCQRARRRAGGAEAVKQYNTCDYQITYV